LNLSLLVRKRLVFYAILLYGFICIIGIFDHFNIFLISDKYFFWVATIMLILPYIGNKNTNIPNYKLNYWFIAILIYMAILGIMQTQKFVSDFQYDLFGYLRFMVIILIGFHREFFTTIKKAMFIILTTGILANIFGIFSADTFVRALVEEKTLAYKMQYMLIPAFYYLFIYDKLTLYEKRIVIIAISLYAVEQILFQKRLPTVRVILYLVAYIYSLKILTQSAKFSFNVILKKVFLFVLGFSVFIKILTFIGFNIGDYFDLLIQRFYSSETVGDTIEEDARWEIGEIFYESLWNSGEFFTGRGLGSVVYHDSFLKDDENGFAYRSGSEMGLPTMFLKGGIFLIGLFAVYLFKILKLYKKTKTNIYLYTSWVMVIIWFIFLYAEGFIGHFYNPHEILLAYSFGFILSAAGRNKEEFVPNENY